jgi:hypothetical protein
MTFNQCFTIFGGIAMIDIQHTNENLTVHFQDINPAPHYINEHQSDIRCIKDGWYAMEKNGNLVSGPFSCREDCLKVVNPLAQEPRMHSLGF